MLLAASAERGFLASSAASNYPSKFFNLFLFGVFASVYALAEGGLWGVSAWHAIWNWTEQDLLGFVSEGTQHAGLISNIQIAGRTVITGGSFGPEDGLAFTAVFLIAIGIL